MNKERYLDIIQNQGDFMEVFFFYYRMNGGTERDFATFRHQFSLFLRNPMVIVSMSSIIDRVIFDVDKYFKIEHVGRF